MRILVVDDDEGIRELLCATLQLEGYMVVTAGDGAAAVDFLTHTPTRWVVLMDIMMPRMSGLEACRRLEASGAGARHRVALMTAGLFDGRECPPPARLVVRKPFDLDAILATVEALGSNMPDDKDALGGENGVMTWGVNSCAASVAAA
jgi:two-component system response regulator MprA